MNSPTAKTTIPSNSLTAQLEQIGLQAVPAALDDFLARATKGRWSPHQVLEQLAQSEIAERSRRSLERRLRSPPLASGRHKAKDAGVTAGRRGKENGGGDGVRRGSALKPTNMQSLKRWPHSRVL